MNWLSRLLASPGFSSPEMLWLLLPVLALLIWECFPTALGVIHISTGERIRSLYRYRSGIPSRLPALGRALGLAFLTVALAGPLEGWQLNKERAGIIDIILCLDVSGSMRETDFLVGGRPRDRMYVAREAARSFIDSRRETAGSRYGLDRVGLVLFSGLAWTQCPLTLDYDVLEHELDRAEIADERKQGTAIGSALGLAVRRLSKSEAKSKVVILLTDGQNNRGDLDPMTAARLAKEYGIRVYTIGAGSEDEKIVGQGFFSRRTEAIDGKMLSGIASMTGGKYYLASDTRSLMNAYDEISEMEATEIEIGDYKEAGVMYLPFLTTGALVLVLSGLARRHWFEQIP